MAAANRCRFFYRREREDGSANETIAHRSFETWLKEAEPGDKFYVAQCRWVQCEVDGTVISGGEPIPHVRWVREVDAVDN